MRKTPTSDTRRGVYVAPWVGPKGETVLIALRRDGRLAGDPDAIPVDSSHEVATDAMWDRLDRDDPQPVLALI